MRDILIVLLIDDIDDIIDGDDAEDGALTGYDRDGLQVILRYDLSDLLLIDLRLDGNDLIVHDLGQLRVTRRAQKIPEVDGADQLLQALLVGDIDRLDDLGLRTDVTDRVECLGTGTVLPQGDVLGGHDTTGTVIRILQESMNDPAVTGFHAVQESLLMGDFHLAQDIYDIILRHVLEHGEQGIIIEVLTDTLTRVIIRLLHDLGQLLGVQEFRELLQVLIIEVIDLLDEVGRLHLLEVLTDLFLITLVDELFEFVLTFRLVCLILIEIVGIGVDLASVIVVRFFIVIRDGLEKVGQVRTRLLRDLRLVVHL